MTNQNIIYEPLRIGLAEKTEGDCYKVQIEPVDRQKLAFGYAWDPDSMDNAIAKARIMASASKLLEELKEAHQIIGKMLNLMTDEQRAELSKLDVGHGAVRYHVRREAIEQAEGAT